MPKEPKNFNRSKYPAIGLIIVALTALFYLQLEPLKEKIISNTYPKLSPQDMIPLDQFIPDIQVELRYATADNFTGAIIYDDDTPYLRRGTAEKLKAAQADFAALGYTIKVWDAYRPPAAQFKLWDKFPDARYVINPHQGSSWHSHGVAVDITLVDKNGQELHMPTSFDDFTARADREYSDIDQEAAQNARLLEGIMLKHGFRSIFYEWWHFIDSDRDRYPLYEPAAN